ncbi:MAG: hypothetical protein R2769_12070 [Saprospiraceae bacterium]
MVDSALFAVEELMRKDKNYLLYGQDVGGRLVVFLREAATLAQKFGDQRVFQYAYSRGIHSRKYGWNGCSRTETDC